ncbi:MAG: VCBS repeat-containing protein [Kiritimatiellae bacterium]|nr:VCBS repeat-containing protein [Kiritimatiellia bacterium]
MSWVGQGIPAGMPGLFCAWGYQGAQPNEPYYVRFFDRPSPDFWGGIIPTDGFYGETFTPFVMSTRPIETFLVRGPLLADAPIIEVVQAPADLAAAPLSTTSVRLTWVDGSEDEDCFDIVRRSAQQPAGTHICLPAGSTSYEDAGLATNSVWFYQVRAGKAGGWSHYTAAVEAGPTPVPCLAFAAAAGRLREAGPAYTVCVTAAPAPVNPVTVDIEVSGTAVSGVDYTFGPATLRFEPGQTQATLVVNPINDALAEPHKTIVVDLVRPRDGMLGERGRLALRLLDDDHRSVDDVDGDGCADLILYERARGLWRWRGLDSAVKSQAFGWSATTPLAGDYDGDGVADLSVYYPAAGAWYLLPSTAPFQRRQFGWLESLPLPADYDGDGVTDLAVYHRPRATWYLLRSAAGFASCQFGWSVPIPVPADYDGDGRADLAVYDPEHCVWYRMRSTAGFDTVHWGLPGAVPVPADYDGDGKTDPAVYLGSTGGWHIRLSGGAEPPIQFGWSAAVPVPADYDGDGRADLCVYHEDGGRWYLLLSARGFRTIDFGGVGSKPVLGQRR